MVTPPIGSSGGIGRLTGYLQERWSDDDRFDVRLVDSRGNGGSLRSLYAVVLACRQLRALLRNDGLDGVHVNLASRGSALRKTMIMAYCRWIKVPYAVTLHGGRFGDWLANLPRVGQWWVRRSLQRADAFIATGERWRQFAVQELRIDPGRVWVIANSTPDPGKPRIVRRASNEPLIIVFSGDLVEFKGIYRLIEALGELANQGRTMRLEIAGKGEEERVKSALREAGIESLAKLHGWVDPGQMSALLSTSHVLVLPSRVENQPMSIIEAMAHGLPVVSSFAGTIPDLVEDGVTGWLVNANDVDALAARIQTLFDETARGSMAIAARERWEQRFTVDHQWRSVSACWSEIFGGEQ